jgi:hypothetical protein
MIIDNDASHFACAALLAQRVIGECWLYDLGMARGAPVERLPRPPPDVAGAVMPTLVFPGNLYIAPGADVSSVLICTTSSSDSTPVEAFRRMPFMIVS